MTTLFSLSQIYFIRAFESEYEDGIFFYSTKVNGCGFL